MFVNYALTLFVDRLVGGIPRHPELVRKWQEARFPKPTALKPGDPETAEAAAERTVAALGKQALGEEVDKVWTGFIEHDGQLAIESRQIVAMLKESANIIKTMVPTKNGKPIPLRARLAERVFVTPDRISLDRTEPDETIERPIHVMTQQGPRAALKRTDIIRDAVVFCRLEVLDDGIIPESVLQMILEHASRNGLGTDRSQGNGKFTYKLERLEEIEDAAA